NFIAFFYKHLISPMISYALMGTLVSLSTRGLSLFSSLLNPSQTSLVCFDVLKYYLQQTAWSVTNFLKLFD
ncbi:hypothetical protein, partial [Streptococcus suis]|uniref:hypothetical protein n=1 Tax=Streptococcus suis TaxID=1307 RepID=UPI002AAB8955